MKLVMGSASAAMVIAVGVVSGQVQTGPSSSQSPYMLPSAPGVKVVSLLTVGDEVGGYRMIGIPDGMGAFDNADGTITFVVNHELGAASGSVRAHGSTGAFVSRWKLDKHTLAITSGRDHNTSASDVFTWAAGSYTAGTTQWARFCSADLAMPTAYRFGNLGTDARIYLNGEENGDEGRGFAHILTGPATSKTYQLPYLGKFSWESSVACPEAQEKTVVIGLDDTTPGQIYVYVGNKQAAGTEIERAGLVGGNLYGVRVPGTPTEVRTTPISGAFELYNFGDVSGLSGGALNAASDSNNVTRFLRPEDGAWDPRPGHHNDFYFVTTDRIRTSSQAANSRLYRLRFADISNPTLGGEVTMLVDGAFDGPNMMDNICVDRLGRVIIEEDIGGDARQGKMWLYNIADDTIRQITESDPARFITGAPAFLTIDEEASGVIDVSELLGDGWYLFDVQAHYGNGSELVEGGQIMAMYIPPTFPCGTSDFNGDGDYGTDADIEAFFLCLGGQCCSACHSGGADFDGNGTAGTDADVEAFFRILSGSGC